METTLGQGVINARRVFFDDPEEYHRIEPCRVSNSMIKSYAEDPESCWEAYVAMVTKREPTPSMIWGRNFETLVFYDRVDAALIPNDVMSTQQRDGKTIFVRKGAAWDNWKAEQIATRGPNIQMLRQDEWDSQITPLLIARDKAMGHEAAKKLLWGRGEAHATYVWEDVSTGVELPCKAQLDILHSVGAIVDLKTAQQAALGSRMALAAHINKFRYHWQAWWYRHVHQAFTGEAVPFVFVFVGNKAPHTVQVVQMDDEWYTLAEGQLRTHLGALATSWQTGVWKPAGWGTIQAVKPPRWASQWQEDSWMFEAAGE